MACTWLGRIRKANGTVSGVAWSNGGLQQWRVAAMDGMSELTEMKRELGFSPLVIGSPIVVDEAEVAFSVGYELFD